MRVKEFYRMRIKPLLKNKAFVISFVLILLIGGVVIFTEVTKGRQTTTTTTTKEETTTTTTKAVTSKLMGVPVDESQLNKKVLAIVVENSTDARPQSGLSKASVIYETIAEGGITRFLTLWQENEADEIGPVRSAREYFLYWTLEYDALFAHVGGSSDALALIGPLGIQDINQFRYSASFWRSGARVAPHNVYTTTEKIRQAGQSAGYSTTSQFGGFSFKEEKPLAERPNSATVTAAISSAPYNPTFTYDRNTNTWLRSIQGVPFKDAKTGTQVAPKNVIIQFTSFASGRSRTGEQSTKIGAVGSGTAQYFIDGQKTVGTWQKADNKSQTKYLDAAGVEIKLNPGQTWIIVMPQGNAANYVSQ